MALTRAINTDRVRYEIARAIIGLCNTFHISVVAEGVETVAEAVTLRELGVRLFQGYLLARPAIEKLTTVPDGIIDAVHRAHESLLLDGRAMRAQSL
jgi:EAL domain-containing protein (putative c-di-GMP-specific phosphodiesterase class I)